jgi:hypothetical protein
MNGHDEITCQVDKAVLKQEDKQDKRHFRVILGYNFGYL